MDTMVLRNPTPEILAQFAFTAPTLTPAMTVSVYDINGKLIMYFDTLRGCQLELLVAWIVNDTSGLKYMYTVRGGKLIGSIKRSDLIVEACGTKEYVKFVGVYHITV